MRAGSTTKKSYDPENNFLPLEITLLKKKKKEITLFISPTYFYLHISLLQCCGVFPFIFHVKKYFLRFFHLFFFFGDFSGFVLDILDCFSYSSLPAIAIPVYIYIYLCFLFFFSLFFYPLFHSFFLSFLSLLLFFLILSLSLFPSLFLFSPCKLNYYALFAIISSWQSAQAQFYTLSIS